jgi:formiminotetrahydrofolate cyclodeaminase
VKINLSAIKDKTFVKELNREVESIESQIKEKEKTILTTVDI